MMASKQHADLKDKVRKELRAFLVITLFFLVVLGSFNMFRRLILGEVGVVYTSYGISLIEAMVLAKIVLIGDAMNLKRFVSARSSIFDLAVLQSILFALLVWLFSILEHVLEGLMHRLDWEGIAHSILRHGPDEIVARLIMMFAAFLPFFALWELRRRLGPYRFHELWFSRSTAGGREDRFR